MPKVAEGMRKLGQRALPLAGESQTRNPQTGEVTPPGRGGQRTGGNPPCGYKAEATPAEPPLFQRPRTRHWVESACEDTSSWQRGVGGWAQVSEI